ncbi:MORN repeat-containing protein 4-like [Aricia agestis]|uniref:MORN repeat-containing protein 4-like n=1 Tax=Aricia agestis TaxID=91739 RepID=UPI001C2037AC|nr:MORN repeat-containing protein 4-like [Aricia agestis]
MNTRPTTAKTSKSGKEPIVVQDEGFFQHDTGDTYNGFYEENKKTGAVKMHGYGEYTTAVGDKYLGIWEADNLTNDVTITYADGSKFEGRLNNFAYDGIGVYTYPDGCVLQANFEDNTPKGLLTLVDPNGHKWWGLSERGYAWFEPVNYYYDMLPKTCESHKKIRKNRP